MHYNKCSEEPILISDGQTDGLADRSYLKRSLSTSVKYIKDNIKSIEVRVTYRKLSYVKICMIFRNPHDF